MKRGIWSAVGAYALWGLLPLYWHALDTVSALQVVSHRIVWSCVLLAAVVIVTRQGKGFLTACATPRTFAIYAVAAVLIGANWFTYIWAVNAGFVVETSLGYFINPLFSVLLGVVFLKERLRPVQWLAVAIAAAGLLYLTASYGAVPWIALVLAVTFSVYGLVKKLAPLGSVQGLTLETGILFLPALAILAYAASTSAEAFPQTSPMTSLLLVGTGVVTSIPLLLFAVASQRIPLLWIGVLQYIQPTLQFLLGVLVFHEAMSLSRLAGFGAVWLALAIFAVEGWIEHRASLVPVTTE